MVKKIVFLILALLSLTSALGQRLPAEAPVNKKVRLDSTNLPIVWISTNGQTVNLTTRVTATMKIIHNGDGQLNYSDTLAHPDQHVEYDGYVGLRYRGNSSYDRSLKKPYSFRPIDRPLEDGGSWKKVALLGMGKDSRWILLAPYNDKSMMRDMLAFELARPWMEYVPDGRYCEVFVDDVYFGTFVLVEQVSQGKHRLNLDDPGEEGDELTGGYLLEVDRRDEPYYYASKYKPLRNDGSRVGIRYILFQYKFPEYEDMTPDQLAYIQGAIDRMEDALAADDYCDPETGYRRYLDVMSFIDYQLAMELSHNVDGYRLSCKIYKTRDSIDPRFKLVLWDFNIAYGNVDYYKGWYTEGWIYQYNDLLVASSVENLVPFWWARLNSDPQYVAQLKNRWAQYRRSNLSDEALEATIDSIAGLLTVGGAEQRNSQAYPKWGKYVWPNFYIATDYADEIAYLKSWLRDRIEWMDQELGFDPNAPIDLPGDVNGDGEVNIADVNAVIDLILTSGFLPAADVNGDGEVNIADVNTLIDLVISS